MIKEIVVDVVVIISFFIDSLREEETFTISRILAKIAKVYCSKKS